MIGDVLKKFRKMDLQRKEAFFFFFLKTGFFGNVTGLKIAEKNTS